MIIGTCFITCCGHLGFVPANFTNVYRALLTVASTADRKKEQERVAWRYMRNGRLLYMIISILCVIKDLVVLFSEVWQILSVQVSCLKVKPHFHNDDTISIKIAQLSVYKVIKYLYLKQKHLIFSSRNPKDLWKTEKTLALNLQSPRGGERAISIFQL